MTGKQVHSISRRGFLQRSTAITAGALVAPSIVPASVFGASAPSNLLAIGSIGTGRMGHGDMSECMKQGLRENARVIAVCDLDSNRTAHAKRVVEKFYSDQLGKSYECQVYSDYRELLARQDIDGVTISTPDHWHALCAVAAANAGKDMYIQKP
ncbi:MAG: Gfo/Idh/MocA family oxidoreductase, partial [Pirellulales bacterium]|nr:Gfo/Idh/MocA family oxidoreductase [Pirellulales bacterium]